MVVVGALFNYIEWGLVKMDWLEALRAAGILVAVIVALLGLRKVEPTLRPRSKLKTDLEILNMLKHKDPYYKVVRSNVDAMITKIYKRPSQQEITERLKVYNWLYFVLGISCFPGFSFWTWYLVKDSFSWWAIATGFLALAGFGWIIGAFDEKNKPQPSKR